MTRTPAKLIKSQDKAAANLLKLLIPQDDDHGMNPPDKMLELSTSVQNVLKNQMTLSRFKQYLVAIFPSSQPLKTQTWFPSSNIPYISCCQLQVSNPECEEASFVHLTHSHSQALVESH